MDEMQKLIHEAILKNEAIVDSELKKIPTVALPMMVAQFEGIADLFRKELEFRKLKEKIQ